MKNRKHDRPRPNKPRGPAPKQSAAPVRGKSRGLSGILWLGGIGFVLVAGYFIIQGQRAPTVTGAAIADHTNSPGATMSQPAGNVESGMATSSPKKPAAPTARQVVDHADQLNKEGVKLLGSGDSQRAIKSFKEALKFDPKNESFHFNLGLAFGKAGELTNAMVEYREALRLLPDYPQAHNNYGNLLASIGRLPEAEEQLTEALNGMPKSAAFNNNLGILETKLNKTSESMRHFQKAIECDSNFLQAHFNLAEAYLQQNDRDKGIAELREALRIKPDYKPAQRALEGVTGKVLPGDAPLPSVLK